jgi:hypothetical protein
MWPNFSISRFCWVKIFSYCVFREIFVIFVHFCEEGNVCFYLKTKRASLLIEEFKRAEEFYFKTKTEQKNKHDNTFYLTNF